MFKKSVTEEDLKSALQQIEQRMHFMEQKNALLEQKIIKLESDNYFLRSELESKSSQLEKRITDFTDVWHPMMMENVNRIKSELVDEVAGKSEELLQKFTTNFKIPDPLSSHVFVGFVEFGKPIFLSKHIDENDFSEFFRNMKHFGGQFVLDSLKELNFKNFELYFLFQATIVWYKGKQIFKNSVTWSTGWEQRFFAQQGLKTILKFCKDNNINVFMTSQKFINGVSIEALIEQNSFEI